MQKFKNFLQDNPVKKNGVVIVWGRFNPPTVGHETVFNEAASMANAKGYDIRIYSTHTHDNKRNPLQIEEKVEYLKKIFPRYSKYFVENGPKNINELVPSLSEEYQNLVVVAGEDRVDDYEIMLKERITHEFSEVEIWSSGKRDPDQDGIEGISASKMREYAFNGMLEEFSNGLPKNTDKFIVKDLMERVREGLGLEAESPVVLKRTKSREKFYKGEWSEGDEVRLTNGSYVTILEKTSNSLKVTDGLDIRNIFPEEIE